MKKNMCEDMFTPEGIPMTSPHDCGMRGAQNWRYDIWYIKCEQENMIKESPAEAYSANKYG